MPSKIRIRKHERGLWFRHGDFVRIVPPGEYRIWSRLWSSTRDTLLVADTLQTRFEHKLLDVILADTRAREAFVVVDLEDDERALLWKDGRLEAIVGPGRHAFWKEPYRLDVEVFRVSELWFRHPKLTSILRHADAGKYFVGVEVKPYEEVLLFRDGEIEATLGAGRHTVWNDAGRVEWRTVDRREHTANVAGQEILTQDKVTVRINLVVTYQITDSLKAVTVVTEAGEALYMEAQLALRAAVGTRKLDAILSDKEAVGTEMREALTQRAAEFGVEVRSIGLRDIILPGEMKTILNEVILAEKQAQANVIRRREETAAARSQANTARILADNPVLARMKELEALEDILAGTQATFVLGRGDLATQIRSLLGPKDDTDD